MIRNKVSDMQLIDRLDLQEFQGDLKKHDNDESIRNLADRIMKRGFSAPIYIWGKENKILDGHQRLKALNLLSVEGVNLKDDKVPVIYIEADSEQEAKDTLLEYNTKYSEFDLNILGEWAKDGDMEFLQIAELESLPDEFDEEQEKIEDHVPTINEKQIIVQKGDIFQLGEHKLMCGDSMQELDIHKLIEGQNENTTHCISDPPYGIAYKSKSNFEVIKNDDTILDYTDIAKKYSNGYFCMWTGYQVVDDWSKLLKERFGKLTNMIVWHKGGGGMGDCARNLNQDFELLIVSNRDNKLATDYRGSATWYWNQEEKLEYLKKAKKEDLKEILEKITNGQTIWKVGKDNSVDYLHPTQKPVEINQRVLENFTYKKDNVIDLFGGSGSNLIACEKTDRTMYMMELDEVYVQVILKRYHEYTKGEKEIKCLNRDLDLTPIYNES